MLFALKNFVFEVLWVIKGVERGALQKLNDFEFGSVIYFSTDNENDKN